MKYRGIEYRILQTTTPNVWAWSFEPSRSIPVLGKTKGHRLMADAAVQRAIDRWLKANSDEEESDR
jgi:hypothetical protein